MRTIAFTLALFLFGTVMGQAQPNTLTPQEKNEGWILLFDGNTSQGWRGYNSDSFPDKGWEVSNETLTHLSGGGGGDIITVRQFTNFELKLEWMIQKAGNSGIFYAALEQPDQPIYWSAPEMQVLDNVNHPDADRGENGNRKAGSLYDLIPAKPQNANPHDEWNRVKIVVKGDLVEHWQNGEKVVSYHRWTPEWYNMIRNSKFRDHPEFGDIRTGHIGLQDHGDRVSFRNIKIRELK